MSHQGGSTLKCKELFSAVLISKQKNLDFFSPEVQNFQTCIINARLGTNEQLFYNPRGEKEHVRCDNSINMMKILICNLRNQGKNMVTIPCSLRIYLLVMASFDRCKQETELVKNISLLCDGKWLFSMLTLFKFY